MLNHQLRTATRTPAKRSRRTPHGYLDPFKQTGVRAARRQTC